MERPFKLASSNLLSHIAFYVCNLMLYWCGFEILWKLDLALAVGLILYFIYHRQIESENSLYWFVGYMLSLLGMSALGSFGGRGWLEFPIDLLCMLPFSIIWLSLSQICLEQNQVIELNLPSVKVKI